ncbi:MAG: hypothetical protein AAGF20_01480 [Pseudomonadota bacterium]
MMLAMRLALPLVAIAQFGVPILPQLGLGESIGARAVGEGIPPELPLGPFFSIWGLIFLAYLGFALFALLRPTPMVKALSMPLLLAGLGNCVWMLSAQTLGLTLLDFVLLLPILAGSWWAAYRLDVAFDGIGEPLWLMGLLVGLLAGWLSVAVSISVPEIVRAGLGRGATDQVWHSLWLALVPAALLAWTFASAISRNRWFFVALVWGLLGVALNNWLRMDQHFLAIATGIVGVIVVSRRVRFGARGRHA